MSRPSPAPPRAAPRLRHAARAAALLLLPLALAAPRAAGDPPDPLADEIARLSTFLSGTESANPIFADVKSFAAPTLERAETARRDGRRLLALLRVAAVRLDVEAARFLLERSAAGAPDEAAFEAEWKRQTERAASEAAPDLDGLHPAALRAIAETALYQAPILRTTSLDYGRATQPDTGLFYLGQARAQQELAALCLALPAEGAARPEPALRDLGPELDALEAELLAAYGPPASVDHHGEFITVSSFLKQAREMNGQGARSGALLAYLQAAMRFHPLRAAAAEPPAPAPAPAAAELAASLESAARAFAADERDQSLGQLCVEIGQSDLAAPLGNAGPQLAAAIVADVLPRYAAALRPPAAVAERPAVPVEVTVTLVRWPFT